MDEVLKRPNTQQGDFCVPIVWVKKNQTELMAEIFSKSPGRAIGKVLLIKFR